MTVFARGALILLVAGLSALSGCSDDQLAMDGTYVGGDHTYQLTLEGGLFDLRVGGARAGYGSYLVTDGVLTLQGNFRDVREEDHQLVEAWEERMQEYEVLEGDDLRGPLHRRPDDQRVLERRD